jgi:hypothetical protein
MPYVGLNEPLLGRFLLYFLENFFVFDLNLSLNLQEFWIFRIMLQGRVAISPRFTEIAYRAQTLQHGQRTGRKDEISQYSREEASHDILIAPFKMKNFDSSSLGLLT